MLFLVILMVALVRGLVLYGIGAVLAVLMWGVCLLLKWPVPSWVRWTLAAIIAGAHIIVNRLPADSTGGSLYQFYLSVAPPVKDMTGWGNLEFGTNAIIIGIVLLALPCTGLIISSVKGLFKVLNKGGKAIKAARAKAGQEAPPAI